MSRAYVLPDFLPDSPDVSKEESVARPMKVQGATTWK